MSHVTYEWGIECVRRVSCDMNEMHLMIVKCISFTYHMIIKCISFTYHSTLAWWMKCTWWSSSAFHPPTFLSAMICVYTYAYKWVVSRMYESCHVWMSHVTYVWVMSRMNESWSASGERPVIRDHRVYFIHQLDYLPWYVYICAHIIELCHVCMSHVTYEWVLSHMNESCHVWTSHVTYEWVMSRTNESCHVWMSHVTYEWVMSRMTESCLVWMSHVPYEWAVSHVIESCEWHVLHGIMDCSSCTNITNYQGMSHVPHEWVVPRVNESWDTWMSLSHLSVSCHI